MTTVTFIDRLQVVGLLSWAERVGLVVPDGHGVRDATTLGFVWRPLAVSRG